MRPDCPGLVECGDYRMNCLCNLPADGDMAYDCPKLGCRMTPHWCDLYQTRADYRQAWDEGRGPGQLDPRDTAHVPPVNTAGPGSQLKILLARFGLRATGCGCNRRAAEMDRRGSDWCRENITLIVAVMFEAARKRKLPLANLSRPAIKLLVRWAISRSERRQTK